MYILNCIKLWCLASASVGHSSSLLCVSFVLFLECRLVPNIQFFVFYRCKSNKNFYVRLQLYAHYTVTYICDQVSKNQPCLCTKIAIFFNFVLCFKDKNNPTCADIHGESYRPPLEQKILMNIQLGVICTDIVDFCRPGHICIYMRSIVNRSYL